MLHKLTPKTFLKPVRVPWRPHAWALSQIVHGSVTYQLGDPTYLLQAAVFSLGRCDNHEFVVKNE